MLSSLPDKISTFSPDITSFLTGNNGEWPNISIESLQKEYYQPIVSFLILLELEFAGDLSGFRMVANSRRGHLYSPQANCLEVAHNSTARLRQKRRSVVINYWGLCGDEIFNCRFSLQKDAANMLAKEGDYVEKCESRIKHKGLIPTIEFILCK